MIFVPHGCGKLGVGAAVLRLLVAECNALILSLHVAAR